MRVKENNPTVRILVNLLTYRRLQVLGTWRTDLSDKVLDKVTKPLPAIGELIHLLYRFFHN